MKKINLIVSVAVFALMLASCNKQYDAKQISLNSQEDSLNYVLGVINGTQLKMMHFAQDSSNLPVKEFITALDKAYREAAETESSEYAMAGQQVGNFFKQQAQSGLANNKAWKYDHQLVCQGFVNGLYGYTQVLDTLAPEAYFQSKYAAMATAEQPEEAIVAKTSSKCPYTAADVELKSEIDSLNYVFGYLNGEMMSSRMIANFSEDSIKIIIDNLNKVVKESFEYPMLVADARNIGRALRDMPGLFNDSTIAVNYEVIRQGIINGMQRDTVMMDAQEAQRYAQTTLQARAAQKSEPNRKAGEEFLANNALREEVTVTESGLQYEVLQKGNGKVHPSDTSNVTVHYHGTLIDGTVFDSSVERGTPASFPLNGVIKGWTEGVQLMVVGDKFRFYIPYDLAYGDRDMGNIKPYSALIFDVELLEIK